MLRAARRFFGVAVETYRRFGKDAGGFLAAAITYNAFLSLFPLMLLGMSVLGFVLAGDPGLHARATETLSRSVPGLGPTIAENLAAVERSRSATGVVGLAGLLWTGTGVADAASFALARIWRTAKPPSGLRAKVRSIVTVLTLGTIGLVGIAAVVGVTAVDAGGPAAVALMVGGVAVGLALDVALFLAAYRLLGPNGRGVFQPWRGALVAAAGWTLLKLIGGWYASRTVANSSAVYGTFASTIGILVILFLAARLFLYGAELNALFVERSAASVRSGDPGGRTSSARDGRNAVQPAKTSAISSSSGSTVLS